MSQPAAYRSWCTSCSRSFVFFAPLSALGHVKRLSADAPVQPRLGSRLSRRPPGTARLWLAGEREGEGRRRRGVVCPVSVILVPFAVEHRARWPLVVAGLPSGMLRVDSLSIALLLDGRSHTSSSSFATPWAGAGPGPSMSTPTSTAATGAAARCRWEAGRAIIVARAITQGDRWQHLRGRCQPRCSKQTTAMQRKDRVHKSRRVHRSESGDQSRRRSGTLADAPLERSARLGETGGRVPRAELSARMVRSSGLARRLCSGLGSSERSVGETGRTDQVQLLRSRPLRKEAH